VSDAAPIVRQQNPGDARAPRPGEAPTAAVPITGNAVVAALMEQAHRAATSGRRELARQRYESALYLLRDGNESSTASTILRRIGRTYLDDGDIAAGMDCLTAALAIAEANDNAGQIAHTVNVMAISYWQRGFLEDAERLYQEAGRMARLAGDERLVAMVEQNLGVVASMRGDVGKALQHHTTSIERYRMLDLQEPLALQLNNIGMAYTGLGRSDDAEAAFAEALSIARACGDAPTRLMIEVNRVALLIARAQYDDARVRCDEIISESQEINETRVLAETHKFCGIIARNTNRLPDADRFFALALAQAMQREDLLLSAETAREQAELYLILGRNRDTLKALSLSHRLFTQLRAQREIADVVNRLRNLEQRFHDLVRKWAQDIESKDAYTLGHCERVTDYACALAEELGFDKTTMFWFKVGALLHDVGKIVVPIEILNKNGPLTPEERSWMERHPVAGVELLREVEFPGDVMPMIRGHHERYDGHGYPDGLAGDDIPLAARILCVADVFDALTSDRPYRKAFATKDALRLMQADTGRQFDPEVLGAFMRIVHRLPLGPASQPAMPVVSVASKPALALSA
jgi:putative nucleotidyltransferase with HDIG domain